MDFTKQFENQFQKPQDYINTDLTLNKKLQDTRHALNESLSENKQLSDLISQLYSEARIENVAVSELLSQIKTPLCKNVALPRNADGLSVSEQAGYAMYYLKFLGFATRKTVEEFHVAKEHLDSMHKSVDTQMLADVKVTRTGKLKIPELDGAKEIKRGVETESSQNETLRSDKQTSKAPLSPPITPPKNAKSTKK
jgi:hypothetical protein